MFFFDNWSTISPEFHFPQQKRNPDWGVNEILPMEKFDQNLAPFYPCTQQSQGRCSRAMTECTNYRDHSIRLALVTGKIASHHAIVFCPADLPLSLTINKTNFWFMCVVYFFSSKPSKIGLPNLACFICSPKWIVLLFDFYAPSIKSASRCVRYNFSQKQRSLISLFAFLWQKVPFFPREIFLRTTISIGKYEKIGQKNASILILCARMSAQKLLVGMWDFLARDHNQFTSFPPNV
jgi:hypothetical protein